MPYLSAFRYDPCFDRLGVRDRVGPDGVNFRRPSGGFTLVELLVVIAIIGILVSLLLPAVQAARESGRRMQCGSKMRQLGIAVKNHVAMLLYFPPATSFHEPRHNVINYLLPYLEEGNVYDKLNLEQNWNSDYNRPFTQVTLPLLMCPSAPDDREWVSDYVACTRIDKPTVQPLIDSGAVNDGRGAADSRKWEGILQPRLRIVDGVLVEYTIRPAHVQDGMSTTMLLFEDAGRPDLYEGGHFMAENGTSSGLWASHTSYIVVDKLCNESQLMNCSNYDELYSFHLRGTNFVFGDGAVRFITEGIDPEIFISLFTRTAGDKAVLP